MGLGFFLTLHIASLVVVALWLRGLVLRRLRPERVLADLRDEVRTLVAEIDHAGDQQVGLIEDRARQAGELRQRLDALIEEATRQVFALDRGVSQARTIRQPPAPVDRDARTGVDPAVRVDRDTRTGADPAVRADRDARTGFDHDARTGVDPAVRVDRDARTDLDTRTGADLDTQAVPSRPAPVATPPRDAVPPAPTHEARTPPDVTHLDPREAVQVLTSAGLSLDLIAMHTGLAKGEVELIVSLAQSGARGPDDG